MVVGENQAEPVLTRTRGADGNLKRSTASPPPWTWGRRRPIVADIIRARRWSWMTVQECTPRQRADLIRMFERRTKHRWLAYAVVNVGVLWDDDKWELERAWHAAMKGGGRKRYTAIVALRRRQTGELFMFCSAHLSVNEPAASMWRLDQALRIHEFLGVLAELTDCRRVIIGADLNSDSMAPDGPARRPHRTRLPLAVRPLRHRPDRQRHRRHPQGVRAGRRETQLTSHRRRAVHRRHALRGGDRRDPQRHRPPVHRGRRALMSRKDH